MEKPNDKLPSIPLKRYFSEAELCYLAQVSVEAFTDWQAQNGFVIGNGGNSYSRQDILFLRKVRDAFEPDIDPFSEDLVCENGEEVLTATEVRKNLNLILGKLDSLLAKG